MSETILGVDVDQLSADAVDVKPHEYDWSEGWPETWDWYRIPDCPECDVACERGEGDERWSWLCSNEACENHGEEVDDDNDLDSGPMMNYYYELPNGDWSEDAARKIADLPLCIVYFEDSGEYALALTGGGMDLSWEICEAYIRLGLLPPVHYCDLPGMSGRGKTAYSEEGRERDRIIVEACKESVRVMQRRIGYLAEDLERHL